MRSFTHPLLVLFIYIYSLVIVKLYPTNHTYSSFKSKDILQRAKGRSSNPKTNKQ